MMKIMRIFFMISFMKNIQYLASSTMFLHWFVSGWKLA